MYFFRILFVVGTVFTSTVVFIFPYTQLSRPDKRIDLNGDWKISFEDRPEFSEPQTDDDGWEHLSLPGNFVRRALEEPIPYEGICWVRKSVSIDGDLPKGALGLCLGRIGNADEVFFNGVRIGGIGSFPPHEFSMWNHPRNYRVPEEAIRFGETNTIAIRISYCGIAEVLGNLFISGVDEWTRYRQTVTFVQTTTGFMSIAMGIALLWIFLFFYLKRPDNQEYLFYCLQLCLGLPVVLDICNYWPVLYGNNLIRFKILAFGWAGLNVVHPIFLHRFYNFNRIWVERFLWTYMGVVLFVGLFLTDKPLMRFNGLIVIVSATSIGLYNMSCHFYAIRNRSPYAKMFSFFGITVVSCAIHDGLVYLGKFSGYPVKLFGYEPTTMIFHMGAVILYAGTALVLVKRFVDTSDEVESLNESLENFILENTMLNEKLEKVMSKKSSITISSLAEEKLKNVIKFINENFMDEISREDLANSVGVHPDSLGKQFKKYTGSKLGDYIYELRINEAARRLRDEDTNIIDIAFDVGFESVRTFNRIFPKFMKTTPNNYRKIHQENDTCGVKN